MTWQILKQQYKTGEEIRLGDQIRYAGSFGIVTSVVYGRDCSSEEQNEEGSDHAIALTITTGAYPLVFIDQAERDLEFLERFESAEAMLNFSGIAPVLKRSGRSTIVHRRFARPLFLHQSFIEYANESIRH